MKKLDNFVKNKIIINSNNRYSFYKWFVLGVLCILILGPLRVSYNNKKVLNYKENLIINNKL